MINVAGLVHQTFHAMQPFETSSTPIIPQLGARHNASSFMAMMHVNHLIPVIAYQQFSSGGCASGYLPGL